MTDHTPHHTPRDIYGEPPRCGVCDRLIYMATPRVIVHRGEVVPTHIPPLHDEGDTPGTPHEEPPPRRKARYRKNPYTMTARTGEQGRPRLVAEATYVATWTRRAQTKYVIVEGWLKAGPRRATARPVLMSMTIEEIKDLLAGSAPIWPEESQEIIYDLTNM